MKAEKNNRQMKRMPLLGILITLTALVTVTGFQTKASAAGATATPTATANPASISPDSRTSSPPPPTPPPPPKTVIGNIDGVVTQPDGSHRLQGWACNQHSPASISVALYVNGPIGTGTLIGNYVANVASEPAVASACISGGSNYRFSIQIDPIVVAHSGQKIYVYGLTAFPAYPNALITNSGAFTVPMSHGVVGYVDGVFVESDTTHAIQGWACNQNDTRSISVALYEYDPTGNPVFIGIYPANLASEPSVAAACKSTGTTYRYKIPIDPLMASHAGQKIYVVGLSADNGFGNVELTNSGNYVFPKPIITVNLATPAVINAKPGQSFTLKYSWTASSATAAPYVQLVHIVDKNDAIFMQGDMSPPTATNKWSGAVTYSQTFTIPATTKAYGTYRVLTGLYNSTARLPLVAGAGVKSPYSDLRFQVATLNLSATGTAPVATPTPRPTPKPIVGVTCTYMGTSTRTSATIPGLSTISVTHHCTGAGHNYNAVHTTYINAGKVLYHGHYAKNIPAAK